MCPNAAEGDGLLILVYMVEEFLGIEDSVVGVVVTDSNSVSLGEALEGFFGFDCFLSICRSMDVCVAEP